MSTAEDDLAAVLRKGVEHVPEHLERLAAARGLTQVQRHSEIQWLSPAGSLQALIYVVPDPGDLSMVARIYKRTKETSSQFTYVLLHQHGDGEGNWDIFTIRPHRRMEHRGRVEGGRDGPIRGPQPREDIFRLFECGQPFPPPGKAGWVRLLAGPREKLAGRLEELAAERACRQSVDGDTFVWRGEDGSAEAMFVQADPADLDTFVDTYRRITVFDCPVTFVWVEQDEPEVYDIFRLSAVSYLEHHNQAVP